MQTMTQLAALIDTAARAFRSGDLTADHIERVETALQLHQAATEQSGEPVPVAEMWAVYFDGEGTRYSSGFVTPWKLYEHREAAQAEVDSLSDLPGRYMACKVFIYTRPQPAPAVPDGWRTMLQRLIYECERADKQALDEVRRGFIHGHVVAEARAILAAEPTAEESSVDQPAPAGPEGWREAIESVLYAMTFNPSCQEGMVPMCACRPCADHRMRTLLAAAPQPAQQLPSALDDIAAERCRQIEVEGWTPEHDDQYGEYVLPCAAGCYAMYTLAYPAGDPPRPWPWAGDWWKPSADPRRNLVKSGALIAAAIERIDRAAERQPNEGRA
ncbi:hypothetical protein VA599_00505 [Chromobacterium sp. TRC.1.1.SA]|uniref:DUF551 domain-containing protein n=1 Tax=Chromobacterium indicum TaxID=3110228 RepID=A0ABV0CDJ6_9NEIS